MSGKVDWRIRENRKSHHTSCYSQNDLILRRGNDFRISLQEGGFDIEKIGLKVLIGNKPKSSNGTLVTVTENNKKLSRTRWDLGWAIKLFGA